MVTRGQMRTGKKTGPDVGNVRCRQSVASQGKAPKVFGQPDVETENLQVEIDLFEDRPARRRVLRADQVLQDRVQLPLHTLAKHKAMIARELANMGNQPKSGLDTQAVMGDPKCSHRWCKCTSLVGLSLAG